MGERPSEFERDADDWYVEPAFCVDALLDRYPRLERLHDPCCGKGTIIDVAASRWRQATGADIVDRASGAFPIRDFLSDPTAYANIVTNPPFRIGADIVWHALKTTRDGGIVAVIAQAKFLFSQQRHPLFARPEMERVLIFSRRPSMPPGKVLLEKGESCRGGGSIDFLWCVWRVGKTAPGASIEWVAP